MTSISFPAPWYRREDYDRIRAIMNDIDNFPETFDEWLDLAEKQLAQFRAQGIPIELVIIDPDRFAAFCEQAKIKPNRQARIQYAARQLDAEKPGHG